MADQNEIVQVDPARWLVGPPPSENSLVVMPQGSWIELKFDGEIVDGPGDDIIIIELGPYGEHADIFITDGAGQEYLLGEAITESSMGPAATEIGFDIFGLPLNFKPSAIRIVPSGEEETVGFDPHSVQARIRQ
jgi:hypothetical protein